MTGVSGKSVQDRTSEGTVHLLRQLKLPSRYESLVATVGSEIASLLVEPGEKTLKIFRQAALHINTARRGLFLPIFAESGTGKTTLVSNISGWLPNEYGPTTRLAGDEVSAERLRQAVAAIVQENHIPLNDKKVLVVNVDDRESDPPSDKELSQIKSFAREAGEGIKGLGSRTLIVWPETSRHNALSMAEQYGQRAGKSPVPIPAEVSGPAREAWPGLAEATLRLVNNVDSLSRLGVDPKSYDAQAFPTIGDFLDEVSGNFVALLDRLLTSTRKPIRLVVVFASRSGKPGVLSEFASGHRYGLVDAEKLLAATPASVIGRWWSDRRGLLVQTIVRLDARATFVSPSLIRSVIHRFGPEDARNVFESNGGSPKPPSEISTYFERSDLGRLLSGTVAATSESRGNPAADSAAAFDALTQGFGFTSGNDKKLNRAFGDFMTHTQSSLGEIAVEKKADGIPLIPDISLSGEDKVTCLEFHWRSGDYLVPANRSEIAQYVLRKLKSYATELGWIPSS